MKSNNSYEAFEETRRKCFLMANLKILEGHLKYYENPVEMLKDPNYSWFAEPFRDYCLNLISFKEAQEKLDTIRSSVISQLTVIYHDDILKVIHKKKTDRDFFVDITRLKSSDREKAKESAVNLVKSFKPSYSKSPIKDIMAKAIIEDDGNFLNTIADAKTKNISDVKRNLDLICFTTFNKEFLNDPELSEAEVLRLAGKQEILSVMVTEESFLKYLRRDGIRMKSKSQIRKEKFKVPVSPLIEKKMESKKNKFATYLFQNFTPDQIRQSVEEIKKSLFQKPNPL